MLLEGDIDFYFTTNDNEIEDINLTEENRDYTEELKQLHEDFQEIIKKYEKFLEEW